MRSLKFFSLAGVMVLGLFFVNKISFAQVAPASVSATVESACSININWTGSVPDLAYYRIEFAKNATNFATQHTLLATTTASSYRHQLLEPGVSYLYRVQAVTNSSGSSIWVDSGSPSQTASIPGVSVPTNFSVNQDPNVSTYGGTMARLAWSGSASGAYQHYEVDRSTTSSFSSVVSATTPIPFFDDGSAGAWLNPNTQYWYRVRTVGSDLGCSPTTNVSSPYVVASVPKIPSNLSASFNIAPNRMETSWSAGSGHSYYEIFRSIGDPLSAVFLATSTNTSYTDTAIVLNQAGNQTYWYKVRGCINGSTKSCSGFAEQQGGGREAASAPQNFGVRTYFATLSGAKNLITWKNGAFANFNHSLERSVNGGGFSTIGTKADSNSAVFFEQREDVPLNEQRTYRARVGFGGGAFSDYANGDTDTSLKYILHGAAWSAYGTTSSLSGVGWISFNSDDVGLSGTTPWSVQINRDGKMSGVAWVSATSTGGTDRGYGWLSFNKIDLVGCPDDPLSTAPTTNCDAILKNGELMGWARFINPQFGNSSSSWSGWVSLNSKRISDNQERDTGVTQVQAVTYLWDSFKSAPKSWTPRGIWEKAISAGHDLIGLAKVYAAGSPVSYSVALSSNNLSGVAWGSNGVGWIAFTNPSGACEGIGGSCTVSVTAVNTPPTVSNVIVRTPNTANPIWCAEKPYYNVDFDYTDPDLAGASPDSLSQIRVSFIRNPVNGAPVANQVYGISDVTVTPINSTTLHVVGAAYEDPLKVMSANSSYKAMVQAQDSNTAWSDWSYSEATTTPAYYYPLVSVSITPNPLIARQPSTFTDTTIVRPGGTPVVSRQWIFTGGTPGSSSSSTVSTLFSSSTNSAGSLTVGDAGGHLCSMVLPLVQAPTGTITHTIKEN